MRASVLLAMLCCIGTAQADMAEQAHRSNPAGIDLITYQTRVKDVVVVLATLPAGDAMASGNVAIPTLSGMMLDRGTKKQDKFAIAEKLNNVGAEIGFETGPQSLEIHAKCLRKDLPLVLGLIAEDLRTPALASTEFGKAQQQFVGALQASAQNLGARAHEAFDRAIFPNGHPNRPHSLEEYETAARSATLDEVKAFQKKYYGPAHMTMVVAGDVGDAETQSLIGNAFSGWSGGQDYIRPAERAAAAGARELSVVLKDKPSVTMILGQPTGLVYRDPDALALRVGTAILGRGFTGRLMHTVRDKEGLTYGISAEMAEDSVADGEWEIVASFAPALLAKGIASTRRELAAWWTDGVTEQELNSRKQGIIGAYQVGLSTTGGLATQILINTQRGFELSWLDDYPKAVKALTREQVNAAIKTHLNPATMVLVEAGSVSPNPPGAPP